MSAETEAYVRLLAQATETFVWLVLALVCLTRARSNPWIGLGALGATFLFVPATTSTAAGFQLQVFGEATIYQNFLTSSLPTVYTLLQVAGAVLLLTALVGRRRPAWLAVAPAGAGI